MSDKLLPCPFCAGKAKLYLGEFNVWFVECPNCIISMGYTKYKAWAIKAWNTRKPAEIDEIIYILKNMNDEKDYGDGSGIHQSSFERYESNRMSKGVLIKNIAKAISEGLNK